MSGFSAVLKMDMGGMDMGGMDHGSTAKAACKISMLWNWNTVNSCFIAKSWQVTSKGAFAGSCIGVFFLVVASNWLHRFSRELDRQFARQQVGKILSDNSSSDVEVNEKIKLQSPSVINPFVYTFSHQWLFESRKLSPTFMQHIIRSVIYTIEWGVSYFIMLLFMYYNGYIIISCILGAFFGKLMFGYESLTIDDEADRACCKI